MNFSYNADGIRTKKSHYNHNDANMYEVSYVLDGTKILSQTYSHAVTKETYTVKFFYDANDAPIAMEYDGNYYYYRTNIQGDIEGIYNANGTLVVSYSYDAWGNILSTTGTLADTVGEINPFRYRGYYYDTETGWYYLQSRYYDPTVGRFLNADALGYVVLDNSILGINLFSYCKNSCVNISDPIGRGPFLAFGVQFAITVGNFTYGIEALWSTSNGKFYLFLFAGGARSFNSKTLRQTELALKEDIMYLMRSVKKFRISDFKIFKKLSISVSFIAVLGNKRASFPGSYCGWFTGVSFTFWNVVASGAIGVSGKAKIGSLGIGVSTSKASIGYGQTFYAQLTGDKKFENNLAALKSGISSKIAFLKLFACFF